MTALTTVHTMTNSQRALVTVVVVVAAHAAVLALLATMKPIKLQRIEPPKPIEVKFVQLAPPPPPPPPPKPKPEPKPKEVKVVQQMPKPLPKPKPKPVIATTTVSDKPQVVIPEQPIPQPKQKEEPVIEQRVEKIEAEKVEVAKPKALPVVDAIYFIKQPDFDFDNDSDLLGKPRTITLRFTVGADGKPKDISVIQGTGLSALDRKVKSALSKATLKAKRIDGVAVEAVATVPFELKLNDE